MSNKKATGNSKKNVRREGLDGWSRLAEATEAEPKVATARVKKLKAALRIFADNAQRGESYPSSSSTQD
jgi:hypothetical protein